MTVDTAELANAAEIKARILRLAARRSECWIARDLETANDISVKLDQDWQRWRKAYAMARGDGHDSYEPSRGSRKTVASEHPVDRFLATRCIADAVVMTPVRQVHAAYEAWAVEEGEDPISPMRLTQELKRRGIETSRTKAARFYRGLAVTAFAESPLANAA